MAAAFGLGAVVLLPALVLSGPGWLLHADGVALALFLGVIPTALAYVLFARGLRRLSASETATLTLAEPLTAGVLGAVVLAEPVTGLSAAGGACVLAGLLALAVPRPLPLHRRGRPRHDPREDPARPLQRMSTVDALAGALRRQILDGELAPGAWLRERELCDAYGVARHSLRAALRRWRPRGWCGSSRIAARTSPSSAARSSSGCTSCGSRSSSRPPISHSSAGRTAARGGARSARAAAGRMSRSEAWSEVNEAHAGLHAAIVAAAGSPRIAAAHAALNGEMLLFLLALRPHLGPGSSPPSTPRSSSASSSRAPPCCASTCALGRDAGGRMSPLDPRLEKHRPAVVYDPQEAYRAMSAASITDYEENLLKRRGGAIVSRAGAGLSLALLYLRRRGRRQARRGRRPARRHPPLPGRRRVSRARLRPREGGRRARLAAVLDVVVLQPQAPAGSGASTRATGRSCRSAWGRAARPRWRRSPSIRDGEARAGRTSGARAITRSCSWRRSRTPATSSRAPTRT